MRISRNPKKTENLPDTIADKLNNQDGFGSKANMKTPGMLKAIFPQQQVHEKIPPSVYERIQRTEDTLILA